MNKPTLIQYRLHYTEQKGSLNFLDIQAIFSLPKIEEKEGEGTSSQQYREPLLLKVLNFGEDDHLRFEIALCSP